MKGKTKQENETGFKKYKILNFITILLVLFILQPSLGVNNFANGDNNDLECQNFKVELNSGRAFCSNHNSYSDDLIQVERNTGGTNFNKHGVTFDRLVGTNNILVNAYPF
jgi:hypothetical protein